MRNLIVIAASSNFGFFAEATTFIKDYKKHSQIFCHFEITNTKLFGSSETSRYEKLLTLSDWNVKKKRLHKLGFEPRIFYNSYYGNSWFFGVLCH